NWRTLKEIGPPSVWTIDCGLVMSDRVISTHAITPSVISSPYLIGIFISGQRRVSRKGAKDRKDAKAGQVFRARPGLLTRLCVFALFAPLRENFIEHRYSHAGLSSQYGAHASVSTFTAMFAFVG